MPSWVAGLISGAHHRAAITQMRGEAIFLRAVIGIGFHLRARRIEPGPLWGELKTVGVRG